LLFLGDDGGDEEEEKLPSCGDYIMHFVTLFWKLLFAFVPPTGEIISVWGKQLACTNSPLLTTGCALLGLQTYSSASVINFTHWS
jgi:hypothetical protein